MPSRALLLMSFTALAAAGCGTATPSSEEDFSGESRRVAATIEDVQRAAERDEAGRICRDFLTRSVADSIAAAGASCATELDKALGDIDSRELEVTKVDVTGTTATATVRGHAEPRDVIRTLRLEKSGSPARWRISALGS